MLLGHFLQQKTKKVQTVHAFHLKFLWEESPVKKLPAERSLCHMYRHNLAQRFSKPNFIPFYHLDISASRCTRDLFLGAAGESLPLHIAFMKSHGHFSPLSADDVVGMNSFCSAVEVEEDGI